MPPQKAVSALTPIGPVDPSRELPLAYTSFFVPPPVNAKNVASQYLRSEQQTWQARNDVGKLFAQGAEALIHGGGRGRKRRRPRAADEEDVADEEADVDMDDDEEDGEGAEGQDDEAGPSRSNTIVICPGSHHLRIGRSSDLAPISLPHILARRDRLARARQDQQQKTAVSTDNAEEDEEADAEDAAEDPHAPNLKDGTDALRNDLKSILRNMKLRPVANGRQQTANYNAGVKPETLAEHQDVFAIDWTASKKVQEDVLVGQRASRLDVFSSDRPQEGDRTWTLFHPFKGGHLNYHDYAQHYGAFACQAALANDIVTLWSYAISAPKEADSDASGQAVDEGLGIPSSDWQHYKVILVVPDLYLLAEVEMLINVLLQGMGFGAVMVQQASVCSTFGAGLSSACVVHVGSEAISVACVDEGLVLADSRISLAYGGDRISEYLAWLLQRANFPYSDMDLSKRLADRWLADELKQRLCTLDPTQLGLAINDFHVRLPNKPTRKFSLRTYDEILVGPMCLFNTRVICFPKERLRLLPIAPASIMVEDEPDETDLGVIQVTLAMTNTVRHLLPPPPPPVAPEEPTVTTTAEGSKQDTPVPTTATATATASPAPEAVKATKTNDGLSVANADLLPSDQETGSAMPSRKASPNPAGAVASNGHVEAADASDLTTPSKPTIDVVYESSKAALDWAVWNSILASVASSATPAAADERMKRMVSNLFCVGGTALMPGLGMAIEARLHNYLSQYFTQQAKDLNALPNITVVPPPRDMDPRIVTWKGSAVLARLDSAQDMWVVRDEWNVFGLRALREKAYFM